MITRRLFFVVAAVVVSLGWILSGAVYGADAPKPAADSKVGFVDVGRVEDECTEAKDGAATLAALETSLSNILKMRQKFSLLTAQELDELEKLTGMDKPGDKDTARTQELIKKGDEMAAELETLRNKKEPTEQEKVRLNELTDLNRKASTEIEARRAQFITDLGKKQKELADKFIDKMTAAMGEVAKDKSITVVLAKPMVYWGGIDLTDDLIAKLNKDGKKQ